MKIRSWGFGLAGNQDFAKGEGLEPQVEKFYKNIKIGRLGEQISATQTYHRRGLEVIPFFSNFLEKIAILMPFGLHFAYFQSHLKQQNF